MRAYGIEAGEEPKGHRSPVANQPRLEIRFDQDRWTALLMVIGITSPVRSLFVPQILSRTHYAVLHR